ncbi:MAG: outer membrane beta-barrel protein [Paludibacteraceae bacterium]|nr:outer membrane beta-barrel protein [Paludibacteraceae bacterium]
MRKSILTLLTLLLALNIYAVDIPKQGFGLQIGFAQPILRQNDASMRYSKDSLVNITRLNGFKIGLTYDASYIAGFGSSIGINYTFAGNSTKWEQKNISFSERTQTIYNELEVFVDWQYKFEVAKETYLIAYTGPSIQCGLSFNRTSYMRNEVTDDISVTKTPRYTTETADEALKRINVTWGIGAGFQYQRYFLRGGYEFGLINPYKNQKFEGLDRYTRGRLDQWTIKIGMYLWYND